MTKRLAVAFLLSIAASVGIAVAVTRYTMERDPLVAVLDRQIMSTVQEIERLSTNSEAIVSASKKALSEFGGQLYVAGVLTEHQQAVMRWWCWGARCERTRVACQASIAEAMLEMANRSHYKTAEGIANQECSPSRIAFCGDDGKCYGDLAFCTQAEPHHDSCRGAE